MVGISQLLEQYTIKNNAGVYKMTSTAVATLTDRMAALRNRASQQAEVWQPTTGDILIGTIAGSETVSHPLYGAQLQMLVRNEYGSITKVWMSRFLQDNLKSQKAELGDLVALTFHGKRKNARGNDYNAYTVIIEKEAVHG
jgi:hypothetical protein